MNKLLDGLERRMRRFAIPNITLMIVAAQIVVFIMAQTNSDGLASLVLVPAKVLEGEVWRLIFFLAVPPSDNIGGFALIFLFFYWYLFYLMGTILEQQWGTARYNLYLLIGYVATVGLAFIQPEGIYPNMFLQTTVFLAFATMFPDFELRLFFILPVKIKWLAMFTIAMLLLWFIGGDAVDRLIVAGAAVNYISFFGGSLFTSVRQKRRRKKWESRQQTLAHQPRHRCVVCGITEQDDRFMDFRYCSLCSGTHCYCSNHLKNHEHITGETTDAAAR